VLPLHLTPGRVFAEDYEVVRPLNEGGMGALFVVEQRSTGKSRALKLMHPQLVRDPKLRQRFVQEARVGAQIASEHVVDVIAAGVDPETSAPYLVMELLDGTDLATIIERDGPLKIAKVSALFSQLGHALGAAHRQGIVHRDLKPENIFLSASRVAGVPFILKVLDFGVAKIVAEIQATGGTTAPIGTPLWMAPEQAEDGRNVSPATDIWALGLIAFYLLTGRPYWLKGNAEKSSVTELLAEILFAPLAPASQRAFHLGCSSQLPSGFDEWFSRCVHRDPTARYRDAHEAFEAWEHSVAGHSAASTVAAPRSEEAPDHLETADAQRVVPAQTQTDAGGFVPPTQRKVAQLGASTTAPFDRAVPRPSSPPSRQRRLRARWVVPAAGLLVALATTLAMFSRRAEGSLLVTVAGPNGVAVEELEVLVDGETRCVDAPCRATGLTEGRHLVEVKVEGYGLAREAVDVERGEDNLLEVTLEPRPAASASLRVPALGENLRLQLNGADRGALPATLSDLVPGTYQIRIAGSERYAPYESTVSVEAGKTVVVEPKLKVIKGLVHLKPGAGADGARVQLVSGSERRTLPKLPIKVDLKADRTYTLVARKWRYREYRRAISFDDGQAEKTFEVSLEREGVAATDTGARATPFPVAQAAPTPELQPTTSPATTDGAGVRIAGALPPEPPPGTGPAPAAEMDTGRLNINSIPASNLILDGRPLGQTPKLGISVSAGSHTIMFIHPEHGRKVITVNVKPGGTATAAVRFP